MNNQSREIRPVSPASGRTCSYCLRKMTMKEMSVYRVGECTYCSRRHDPGESPKLLSLIERRMRQCQKCGMALPLSSFRRNAGRCKVCLISLGYDTTGARIINELRIAHTVMKAEWVNKDKEALGGSRRSLELLRSIRLLPYPSPFAHYATSDPLADHG